MRAKILLLFAVLLALITFAFSTFHGYVNPLRHYDPATGKLFAFNLTDGESQEELITAIDDFLARKEEYIATVARLSRSRVGMAPCDTSLGTQNLWPHMERLQSAGFLIEGRYVNVGAGDGMADDPLYEYAHRTNASGVAVERDAANCDRHLENLPNVRVACTEVTPANVLELILDGWAPPRSADILKVDIDSFDCPVAEVLVEAIGAKMILLEVNPSIPPPYQWAMLHHPELWTFFRGHPSPQEVPIRGCSLAYAVDLLGRFGYDFLAFGGHDALFSHQSVRSAWLPLRPPMDEFDCYNEAFIAANGISISKTRRWFFEVSSTHVTLPEIFEFFAGWMRANAPTIFPFVLRS